MALEGPGIPLAGPCPSKVDTGYYSSCLDLFFAMCPMGEVASWRWGFREPWDFLGTLSPA